MGDATREKLHEESPYPYWGGWTERGELLHLAASSAGQCARSACGLVLTGGAVDAPPDGTAVCRKCARAWAKEAPRG